MSKKWITFLVAAVVSAMLLTPTVAMATCTAQVLGTLKVHDVNATGGPADVNDPTPLPTAHAVDGVQNLVAAPVAAPFGKTINTEGVVERVADLLIYDATGTAGAGFCFNAGNIITITFNGVITNPAVGTSLSTVNNLDVYDSAGIGGLSISSSSISSAFAAGGAQQTIITINIGANGTPGGILFGAAAGATGSALRVKNLRIDATSVFGGATVAVNLSQGSTSFTATPNNTVATIISTIGSATNPVIAAPNGVGTQNSNKGLDAPQTIAFTEGFGGAFRRDGTTASPASGVSNDIATNATSLIFNVTSIPSGVTVTFPSTLSTSAAAANGITWNARSTTLAATGGSLLVIYDTFRNGGGAVPTTIETADNADKGTPIGTTTSTSNPNCLISGSPAVLGNLNAGSLCNNRPKIGVKVGATSGSGTAQITVGFGPGVEVITNLGADDVSTTAIPRYKGDTRVFINKKNFFTIDPTNTVLLFPLVSTLGGFDTGLAMVNTCNDAGVYSPVKTTATCSQTGGVKFYFFGVNPLTGATVTSTLNTEGAANLASACRGFDANGRVVPGTGAACVTSALLPLLSPAVTGFDGYVIAVTSFQNAHGFSAQFNAAKAPFAAASALVLPNTPRVLNEGGLNN